MRTAILFTAAVTLAAAIILAFPPQNALAGDAPPLINFLAKKVGAGQSYATQTGYNAYLYFRFTQGESPAAALESCQTNCHKGYGDSAPGRNKMCEDGCSFLNSKE